MGLAVFQNLAGTIRSAFRLGRSGPTLRQGATDPNEAQVSGLDGDIYIQHDADNQLFQRRNGVWMNIGGEAFSRKPITTATYNVAITDHYLGVNHAGPVDIFLPPGVKNKQFIIKDESGLADKTNRPINIIPYGDELIDGDSEMIIVGGFTSLTIVFGDNWHLI
jgi:hypothetical protein